VRANLAAFLCLISKGIVGFMAVITGLGLTIALIVLAINGTISVAAAIVAWFLVLPLVEMVIFWLSAALAFVPLGIAKLLDRELVSERIDSQPIDEF
jgi:hypothetical protein